MAIKLGFYVGQTKKEYTENIKKAFNELDKNINELDANLNERINTKIQVVWKNDDILENTRPNDFIFKIIE